MSVFIISNVKSSTQQNVSVIKILIQNTKITLKNIFQSGQNITDKSQEIQRGSFKGSQQVGSPG